MPGSITVLHVDDEPGFAETAGELLERAEGRIEVVTAADAGEALERLEGVDCVVSDYDMPGMDGIGFLEAVREEYPDLPFILFTGKGSEEVASDAISAGATDYLQKEAGTDQYTVLANRIENAVDQYRSRRALEASQKRLSLFIEQSPLGVIEWDEEFRVDRINEAGEEILGYTEEELRGRSWETIVPEEDRGAVGEVVAELLEARGGYHSVNKNVRGDGERIICEWHNRVITDDDGETVAIFSQFQDVTARKRRERRLEALHGATRELMTADSPDEIAEVAVETAREVLDMPITGVMLHDEAEGVLRTAATTEEAIDLLGEPPVYEPGESLSWEAFRSGEARVFEDVSAEPGRHNPDTEIRAEIILPIGEHGVVNVGSTEVGGFDDADVSMARILAANTEAALTRAEHERELERQNERLEEFASIVSHDLRNPLNVLQGTLDVAEETGDPEHFRQCRRTVARMERLVEDLLTLAREGGTVSETSAVDLRSAVRECWRTVAADGADVEVRTGLVIEADTERLRQLLENLFRNAIEHTDGSVTVTVGDTEGGFYVADDGPGIPEEERDRVFEAGYSTTEEGTGFGLNIVERIAEVHGWEVRLTESEAGGARFEITGVEAAG